MVIRTVLIAFFLKKPKNIEAFSNKYTWRITGTMQMNMKNNKLFSQPTDLDSGHVAFCTFY